MPAQNDADDSASAPLLVTALPRQRAAHPSSSGMEQTFKKVVDPGRGLAWSPPELLALAVTAPLLLQDAAIGGGQTASALQWRLLSRFAARAPPAAGSKPESGGNRHPRRWGGRTARACKVRWEAVKASCIVPESVAWTTPHFAGQRTDGNMRNNWMESAHWMRKSQHNIPRYGARTAGAQRSLRAPYYGGATHITPRFRKKSPYNGVGATRWACS